LAEVAAEFERGHFKSSGLAGAFRNPSQTVARSALLKAIGAVYDLAYLFGEVGVHFQHVSSGLGDYGAIRVAPWLHPFLDALVEKVQSLKQSLEVLNKAVEEAYVLARAKGGRAIEKPAPSERMCKRAHAAFERAIAGRGSHYGLLLQALADLKVRSAPERLPELKGNLGDACSKLQHVLFSQDFRRHVGDSFPADLPRFLDNSPRSSCTRVSPLRLADDPNAYGDEVVEEDMEEEEAIAPIREEAALTSRQFARAEVHRLVRKTSGSELMRHDQRSLLLDEEHLAICRPGSSTEVKTRVHLPRDLCSCEVSARTMTLEVMRLPSFAPPGSGVAEHKTYAFEFHSREAALAFQREMLRRQGGRREM
jgi:hypothetical protein